MAGVLVKKRLPTPFLLRGARQPALIDPITFKSDARRGPFCFRHPAAGALFMKRPRRDALLHPDTQHRLRHNGRVGALQPVIPPAERLLQESDRWTGHAVMRIEMRPGSDEAFARALSPANSRGTVLL